MRRGLDEFRPARPLLAPPALQLRARSRNRILRTLRYQVYQRAVALGGWQKACEQLQHVHTCTGCWLEMLAPPTAATRAWRSQLGLRGARLRRRGGKPGPLLRWWQDVATCPLIHPLETDKSHTASLDQPAADAGAFTQWALGLHRRCSDGRCCICSSALSFVVIARHRCGRA